jgi:hypothetical protein
MFDDVMVQFPVVAKHRKNAGSRCGQCIGVVPNGGTAGKQIIIQTAESGIKSSKSKLFQSIAHISEYRQRNRFSFMSFFCHFNLSDFCEV